MNDVEDVEEVKQAKEKGRRTGSSKRHMDLPVYQQSYRLTLKFTKLFPREEQFELGRQLRRGARSVPANVVEGWTKRNSPENSSAI